MGVCGSSRVERLDKVGSCFFGRQALPGYAMPQSDLRSTRRPRRVYGWPYEMLQELLSRRVRFGGELDGEMWPSRTKVVSLFNRTQEPYERAR